MLNKVSFAKPINFKSIEIRKKDIKKFDSKNINTGYICKDSNNPGNMILKSNLTGERIIAGKLTGKVPFEHNPKKLASHDEIINPPKGWYSSIQLNIKKKKRKK